MGWDDSWTHTPSYFRQYHLEYAAPRNPMHAGQPYVDNDRFKPKDRSRVQNKKKIVKQIYVVKKDGRKDKCSDLNAIDENPINMLKTSDIGGKGKEKLSVDIPSVKSEQSKLKGPKIKKEVPLSKIEVQPRCLLELKEKCMAWVPKGSIQTQDKNDVHTKGATQLKEKRRSKRRSSNMRFAPNCQNYWLVHHPSDLQLSYTPIPWNSSYNMFGYPSYFNFDPRMPYGSLYHGGLLTNCYAY
ncbi:hypothetical protein PVAP13_5NG237881 [Panicum virgatum]|uniref:Uncharacterized protein n=1 Tax=Panicum virgatum TaxID=38727 RepID=A0A8T0RX80_PANVG|nr:hypothetical protein PVAP13_5NG237881 [Panicum virgatum]